MATISAAKQVTLHDGVDECWLWAALTATNTIGSRVNVGARPYKSVQVLGTFGATVTMRGSNKPDPDVATAGDWFTLTDGAGIAAGNNVAFTAAGGKRLYEDVLWVSPLAGAVTSVDVYLLAASPHTRAT